MHVLLVDDNEDDLILICDALAQFGGRVHADTVQCGEEAVAFLHGGEGRDAIRPDLVLLDINMPRMNGFDVLGLIRGHPDTRNLPVLVLTTSDHPGDIQRAYADGANSYLCKPLDYKELVQVMHQTLEYWSDTVRLPGLKAGEN
ncbi:MAG: response regulator [Planctomycetota bacterium]